MYCTSSTTPVRTTDLILGPSVLSCCGYYVLTSSRTVLLMLIDLNECGGAVERPLYLSDVYDDLYSGLSLVFGCRSKLKQELLVFLVGEWDRGQDQAEPILDANVD
jgi:hypothetical protein